MIIRKFRNFLIVLVKSSQTDLHDSEKQKTFPSFSIQFNQSRKHYLSELERNGQDLCKEHAHILHQIEHISWHLEGCTRHRPCMGRNTEGCPKKSAPLSSCVSASSAPTCNRPSAMVRPHHRMPSHSIKHIQSFVHACIHLVSNQFEYRGET